MERAKTGEDRWYPLLGRVRVKEGHGSSPGVAVMVAGVGARIFGWGMGRTLQRRPSNTRNG